MRPSISISYFVKRALEIAIVLFEFLLMAKPEVVGVVLVTGSDG